MDLSDSRVEADGLGDFAGGFFEEFVDEGLVGLESFSGHTTELAAELRGDANGDGLFGVSRSGAADSRSAAQFGIRPECQRSRACYLA